MPGQRTPTFAVRQSLRNALQSRATQEVKVPLSPNPENFLPKRFSEHSRREVPSAEPRTSPPPTLLRATCTREHAAALVQARHQAILLLGWSDAFLPLGDHGRGRRTPAANRKGSTSSSRPRPVQRRRHRYWVKGRGYFLYEKTEYAIGKGNAEQFGRRRRLLHAVNGNSSLTADERRYATVYEVRGDCSHVDRRQGVVFGHGILRGDGHGWIFIRGLLQSR